MNMGLFQKDNLTTLRYDFKIICIKHMIGLNNDIYIFFLSCVNQTWDMISVYNITIISYQYQTLYLIISLPHHILSLSNNLTYYFSIISCTLNQSECLSETTWYDNNLKFW